MRQAFLLLLPGGAGGGGQAVEVSRPSDVHTDCCHSAEVPDTLYVILYTHTHTHTHTYTYTYTRST
jgi:hypothetical protein